MIYIKYFLLTDAMKILPWKFKLFKLIRI